MHHFVIDTNVFIFMNQFNQALWMNKLAAFLAEEHQETFHVTTHVLQEMPFLRGSAMTAFKKLVSVHNVKDTEIAALKQRMKERNPAQDPDLTLLIVADRLEQERRPKGETSWLVSDDFKLVEQTRRVNAGIQVLTPGAFMLKLATISKDSGSKRFFKSMEKKVTEYSISYILSRKDIYPAAQKLSWLIDRTASLVGVDIEQEEHGVAAMNILREKTVHITSAELDSSTLDKLRVADMILGGHPVDAKQRALVSASMEFLDTLKGYLSVLATVKVHARSGETTQAREAMKDIDTRMLDMLVRARFDHPDEFPFISLLVALQLHKVSFYHAYTHLVDGEIEQAMTRLASCTYWAMQGKQDGALLNAAYMRAMILFFNDAGIHELAREAIHQFEHARIIAEGLHNDEFQIKALLGEAIALFQLTLHDEARDTIRRVREIAVSDPDAAVTAFSEMADCFLVFGKADYATFLYDEALEAAIVAGQDHKKRALLEKMQRSYLAAGSKVCIEECGPGGVKIDQLLDESFHLGSNEHIEAYNEEIMKLAMLNALQHEPFPHVYKEWTPYKQVDDGFKRSFEIIEIEDMDGLKSRITAFSSSMGLVGFVVPSSLRLSGPAESHVLELAKTSVVKTRAVQGDLFEKKLIRALVYLKTKDDVILTRHVPSFLQVPG